MAIAPTIYQESQYFLGKRTPSPRPNYMTHLQEALARFKKEFPHLGKPIGGEIYGCEKEVTEFFEAELTKAFLDGVEEGKRYGKKD